MTEKTRPEVQALAVVIAEVSAMTEAEAKAALLEQRTREYFEAQTRGGAGSGEMKRVLGRLGAKRLTIGAAVLEACRGVWLEPLAIVEAVLDARPGTNAASVYPEIMRAKKSGALRQKNGQYQTA